MLLRDLTPETAQHIAWITRRTFSPQAMYCEQPADS